MDFPSEPRVSFQRSSLVEVICQLRFAPILRIETTPAGVQERLRQQGFSSYEARTTQQFVGLGLGAAAPVVGEQRVEHLFENDEGAKVILARDFVAVDLLTKYPGWPKFHGLVTSAASSVEAEFAPVKISRIGLRYQNVVVPSALGLKDVPWSRLFKPEIIGLLATEMPVFGISQQIDLKPDSAGNAAVIRHGLVVGANGEDGYVIDMDFYADADTTVRETLPRLELLHLRAWNFFRWCLTPELYDAMSPVPLEE